MEMFPKNLQKSRFSKSAIKNRDISKNFDFNIDFFKHYTKIAIFGNLDQNRDASNRIRIFFVDFDQTWNFHHFWPISLFFENFVQNWDFRKKNSKMEAFRKSAPKSRFLKIDQNRHFSKILTKILIFRKFDTNWDFSKIWPKWRCFENFDQNRDLQKFWSKSRYFENLHQ